METTLYENGDTFKVRIQRADSRENGKRYIFINDVLHELISKEKINAVTITEAMSEAVKPH